VDPAFAGLELGKTVLTPIHEALVGFEDPRERAKAAAKQCIGSLDLLRVITSRMRLVVVLGRPDAGKTSFLNSVFALNLRSGLEEVGRTKCLTIKEGPGFDANRWPLLIVDIPGIKDKIETRDDVIAMTMSLLEYEHIKDSLLIVTLFESGERDKTFEKLIETYHHKKPKMAFVCTKCDHAYMARVVARVHDGIMPDPATREQIANDLIKEDKAYVQRFLLDGQEVMYAMTAGKVADYQRTQDVNLLSNYERDLCGDLQRHFNIMDPLELQRELVTRAMGDGNALLE